VLANALELAERAFGPRSLAVCWALNDLGMSYKFLARFLEAGPLYQRALAIAEDRLGRTTPISPACITTSAASSTRRATGCAANRSRASRCASGNARSDRGTCWSRTT
jgi:hypothetical protein